MDEAKPGPFQDRAFLTALLQLASHQRDLRATEFQDVVKFYLPFLAALLGADVFLIGGLAGKVHNPYALMAAFAALPSAVVVTSWAAQHELRRRFYRLIETLATLSKIQDLLGLNGVLPRGEHGVQVFPGESRLYQRFWSDLLYAEGPKRGKFIETTEEWSVLLERRRGVLGSLVRIFQLSMAAGIVMAIAGVGLGFALA